MALHAAPIGFASRATPGTVESDACRHRGDDLTGRHRGGAEKSYRWTAQGQCAGPPAGGKRQLSTRRICAPPRQGLEAGTLPYLKAEKGEGMTESRRPPARAGKGTGAQADVPGTDGTTMKEGIRSTQWKPGQSGNPRGRTAGSRSKTLLALDALGEGEVESIVRAMIDRAKEGDAIAAPDP
jgi:Family of unknown function (DUF5681)